MSNEGLGDIPAVRSKQSSIRDRSSGYSLVSGDAHISAPEITITIGDESSPMPDGALNRILEEIRKPRYAFERTLDGNRYTRKIR